MSKGKTTNPRLILELQKYYEGLSDEELVKEIVSQNNPMLFEFLYDRYDKVVYNKCYGFSRSMDEARDLTQDVFLNLYLKLGTFKGQSRFSTWLYALTYNFCTNYVNRDKQRKIRDKSAEIDEERYKFPIDVSDDDLFELKVEKLKKAMDEINPEEKSLLLLKYQDGVSVSELTKLLGVGESAVKMRLKRARAKVIETYNKLS